VTHRTGRSKQDKRAWMELLMPAVLARFRGPTVDGGQEHGRNHEPVLVYARAAPTGWIKSIGMVHHDGTILNGIITSCVTITLITVIKVLTLHQIYGLIKFKLKYRKFDGMVHRDGMICMEWYKLTDRMYEIIHIFYFGWLGEMVHDDLISYLKGVIKLMNDLLLLIKIFLYL
jgi:hypothetical protein